MREHEKTSVEIWTSICDGGMNRVGGFALLFVLFTLDIASQEDKTIPDLKPLNLTAIGCFYDKGGEHRPFPYVKHQINYFIYNDWNNMTQQIVTCRNEIKSKGYKYFGLQFYGECWYGPPLRVNYAKDEKSSDCINGAGAKGSLMVYRING